MQNMYTKDKEETLNQAKDKVTDTASAALRQGEEKLKEFSSQAQKKLKEGKEQLDQVITTIDKQLHDNPWPIVGGVAVSCLLIGFLMGTSKRN